MVKKYCFCSDPFDSNVQKAIEAEREETKNKHEFGNIFLSKSITGLKFLKRKHSAKYKFRNIQKNSGP